MVLEALVKGSGQNRYSVYLIWDTVRDEMVEADCECPAFREYEGICKHCVAVLLQYYSDSRVKAYGKSWSRKNGKSFCRFRV